MYPAEIWGGSLKETVLWTNPSPTSSTGFAPQTVTLSDNISHYKYIAIVCRWSNDAQSGFNTTRYIFVASELPNCVSDLSTFYPIPYLGLFYNNLTYYFRPVLYVSDTSLSIGQCYYTRTNTTPTVGQTAVIPIQIIGLK